MSEMRVTMLLADNVQAVGGKLYILGGGWDQAAPGPVLMAIALKVEVPWTEANRSHKLKLALFTDDEQPVKIPAALGDQPVEVSADFEVGRPAGVREGSDLGLALAINLPPIPLAAGTGYVWRCWIDNQAKEDWRLTFATRPAPHPAQP